MKVKELMERVGSQNTGRIVAYIKDGLEEINTLTEVFIREETFDIKKDVRFHKMPNEVIKVIDITVKNHLNSKDEYRSIPRMIYEPGIKDSNNV